MAELQAILQSLSEDLRRRHWLPFTCLILLETLPVSFSQWEETGVPGENPRLSAEN